VDAILHFAGSVVVPESVSDPLKYYRNNTAASRSLIESAVAEGVKHFIFSSTAATYGTPDKVPVAEGDPTVPINPYGMSKLMTEAMLRDVAAAHPINYAALRYFNVAGADSQGANRPVDGGRDAPDRGRRRGGDGQARQRRGLRYGLRERDGTGVRDYIHVSDLAGAPVAALALLRSEPVRSHTLNCGYGRGFSVNQVLDAVDRITNVTIARRYEGRRAVDPAELIADNRAILAATDWRRERNDLDLIVRDALAWERALAERGDEAARVPSNRRSQRV
jgi:UDP-glucose 4-epimerase